MATRPKSAAKPSSASAGKRSSSAGTQDAVALLKADHAEVKTCFETYQQLVDDEADGTERQPVAEQICMLLTVHATIEEEIFYPAARELLDDDADLVDEADVEHASAKSLIAQLRAMDPDEELYDAKVKVLGEYIAHHVGEEESEMFPKLVKAGLDTDAIGVQLAKRKGELMAEMAEGVEEVDES